MLHLILLICLPLAWTIPIDNGVEGDPEIECGASSITVSFNTRNNFEGHVYVKGRFGEAGCRNDEVGRKVASINLPFTACGVERSRSLNPRGVFVRNTVVITFHPQFLTKVDRAYTVQCFYMEADKTVSQELEVSEITTQFQSQQVPMPVCRYDILDNGPTGQPIKFALIGQQVYHKWTCDTETTDIFCMVVHSCFVDDGAGNAVNLLNENGCGLDKHLLQNLEYTTDLMAGRESHVFKYADKAALFFQCQITITIKEPGQQCARPQCPEPGGPGAATGTAAGALPPARPAGTAPPKPPSGTSAPRPAAGTPAARPAVGTPAARPPGGSPPPRPATGTGTPPPPAATIQPTGPRRLSDYPFRFRQRLRYSRDVDHVMDEMGTWDVRAQPITALDLDDDQALPANLQRSAVPNASISPVVDDSSTDSSDFCVSPISLGILLSVTGTSIVAAVVVIIRLCLYKSNKD